LSFFGFFRFRILCLTILCCYCIIIIFGIIHRRIGIVLVFHRSDITVFIFILFRFFADQLFNFGYLIVGYIITMSVGVNLVPILSFVFLL
jgi:hypothetical protein